MKDIRLVKKICYFKNKLIYPNKLTNTILSYISFKMKKLVSLSLKNCVVPAVSAKSTRYHILGTKMNINKTHHAAYKIVFCFDVLQNRF